MIEKNNIIADWLDRHGDPEIDKFVETQLTQNEMKKQTAVEWLVEKLKENGVNFFQEEIEMIEEAKEMEKQQIIEAHYFGYADTTSYITRIRTEEQYYNETFKSE